MKLSEVNGISDISMNISSGIPVAQTRLGFYLRR